MFKQVIIPALVLAAASAAALPAAAQSYGHQGPRPVPSHQGPTYQGPAHHNNGGNGYGNGGYNNWQSINSRQVSLDRRIDQGIRNGSLNRREATRLRGEFNALARLEANYRRGGLTAWERSDLDRRFDRLSQSIRYENRDRDYRRH